jgi:16S rRNA (guanine527-N7)-methyltransferase
MTRQEKYLGELKSFFWENSQSPEIFQLERLAHFAELVAEKNEEVNLISRRDIKNLIENHVFLSAYISKFIPEKATTFIDIGTGGGFPGIPVGIMKPFLRGTLVDSTAKKINAVNEFINKLKLGNLTAVNSRVEDKEFIEKNQDKFDLVLSRGTTSLIILMRYSLPIIKEKAYLMAIKGGDLREEIETAKLKYGAHIKKATIIELGYKPNNVRNEKEKRLVVFEVTR